MNDVTKAPTGPAWAAELNDPKEFATVGTSVPLDFAEQVREAAKRRGITVSAFTMQALADAIAKV